MRPSEVEPQDSSALKAPATYAVPFLCVSFNRSRASCVSRMDAEEARV